MTTEKEQVVTAMMPKRIKIQDRLPAWMISAIWAIGVIGSMSDAVSWTAETVGHLI